MSEPKKTWDEINAKIAAGKATVITAEEAAIMSEELAPAELAKAVDVVTTGTFGAMCSSGMFINFGHPEPPIRMEKITLDGVAAYAGIAAVDAYIGATETHPDDPKFGGSHVIQKLISGDQVLLRASAKGTDCYPRKEIETWITKDSVNEMILVNPRNAYQNYPAAINTTHRTLYTYMGTLLPDGLNVNYSSAACLSPLLNDPYLRTIGIGSPLFLGGTVGVVAWNGTQFNTEKARNDRGLPLANAATLMLVGDAKKMDPRWLRAAYFEKYGNSMYVGVGFAIPVLDEDMAYRVSVRNDEIDTSLCDYGQETHPVLKTVNYAELMSGAIAFRGRQVKTASLSSLRKAREIAEELKRRVQTGAFPLSPPNQALPEKASLRGLKIQRERKR